ncbi:GntR family transcriptional regulator [Mycolicibacterium goodii]|uniref:GntR family transcriptional regulator n=1 Tax=Mycolicibacterium goodii TaxID=134601 RepID=A0ABS6HRI2_MYCGD|nr:GntR family transcriptional regulator [Mycolicibacterium goodii]MBU8823912.1 GntR family transcriptional regulator [Mycolicibacterium goodii]MBU8836557.1 GntR family transcriptional regulator [Mycolicibacterium goodii]
MTHSATQPGAISDFVPVDQSVSLPLYVQVIDQIENGIRRGSLPPGSFLPAEPQLVRDFQVARGTLRRAIDYLIDKGLIVRVRGVGTRVAAAPGIDKPGIRSLYAELAAADRKPATRVLTVDTADADRALSDISGFAIGTPLRIIRRLRLANDLPVAVMENYFPAEFPEPRVDELTERSMDEYWERIGHSAAMVRQEVIACLPTAEQSALLRIEPGTPILSEHLRVYDDSRQFTNYSRNFYHPTLYRMTSVSTTQ